MESEFLSASEGAGTEEEARTPRAGTKQNVPRALRVITVFWVMTVFQAQHCVYYFRSSQHPVIYLRSLFYRGENKPCKVR